MKHPSRPGISAVLHQGMPNFKPTRDRHVSVRDATDCPSCGAAIGEFCATAAGKKTQHKERRRIAIRIENGSLLR